MNKAVPMATSASATPWVINLLQIFSAWFASLMLLGFLALTMQIIDSIVSQLISGGILLGVAYGLFRHRAGLFFNQFALAISLSGQALICIGLHQLTDADETAWWGTAILQLALLAPISDRLHRGICVFACMTAFTLAWPVMTQNIILPGLVIPLICWFWINADKYPGHQDDIRAAGVSLMMVFIVGHFLWQQSHLAPGWFLQPKQADAFYHAKWISSALCASTMCFIVSAITRTLTLTTPGRILSYAGAILLALLAFELNGLSAALILILTGYAVNDKRVSAIGMLSASAAISVYYYQLDTTLMAKAGYLTALGVMTLSCRQLMRVVLRDKEVADES